MVALEGAVALRIAAREPFGLRSLYYYLKRTYLVARTAEDKRCIASNIHNEMVTEC